MYNLSLVGIHPRPFRRVALAMAVIALAHPQKATRHGQHRAVRLALDRQRPQTRLARPRRAPDRMAKADVLPEIVLGNHLPHVVQDRLS